MGVAQETGEITELVDFLETVFQNEKGVVYLAFRVKGSKDPKDWKQEFFNWPEQKDIVLKTILTRRTSENVYFAPSLFNQVSEGKGQKTAHKGSHVIWCEFDHGYPDFTKFPSIPEPNIVVQTSTEDHVHCYWILTQALEKGPLEKINRALAYMLDADTSGWDCNQVLRPPLTFNHKRELPVKLLRMENVYTDINRFAGLPDPPPPIDITIAENLPPVEDVIAKYPFSDREFELFKKGRPVGERSTGLMNLGYILAQKGARPGEVLSLLMNADARWGKFSDRRDRIQRLGEIVTIACNKYPQAQLNGHKNIEDAPLVSMGLRSLLATHIKLEWVWEGWIQKNGYGLLTGPSGVGKTQLSLELAAHMAMGLPYLGHSISPQKVGFFSLEMGLADVKHFLLKQVDGIEEAALDLLEQNFRLFPLGEPLYFSSDKTKRKIEDVIKGEGLDGIMVDSMGSTTDKDLSKEESVRPVIDWNDRIRQELNVWTYYIHHHRKANADNKKPNKLSDVYGNQMLTARATTVLTMWPGQTSSEIELIPLKIRLASNDRKPIPLKRDGNLRFKLRGHEITIVEEEPPTEEVSSVVSGRQVTLDF